MTEESKSSRERMVRGESFTGLLEMSRRTGTRLEGHCRGVTSQCGSRGAGCPGQCQHLAVDCGKFGYTERKSKRIMRTKELRTA